MIFTRDSNSSFYLFISDLVACFSGYVLCKTWLNPTLIYIFLYQLFLNRIYVNLELPALLWQPSWPAVLNADTHSGQFKQGFMGRDTTVFHAICCVWPLRWWSAGRMTPGRIFFKEQPHPNGGSSAWQHAGGLISPSLKGQIQKA